MASKLEQIPHLRRRLFAAQKGLCFICEQPMAGRRYARRHGNGWTREHVVPVSRGGKKLERNVVLAHYKCNHARGDRAPTEQELQRCAELYRTLLKGGDQ